MKRERGENNNFLMLQWHKGFLDAEAEVNPKFLYLSLVSKEQTPEDCSHQLYNWGRKQIIM